MIYKVSTTGDVSEVVLNDLGARTLVHPVVDLDLGLEYTDDELLDSDDLATAVANGWITIAEKSGSPVTEEEVEEIALSTVSGSLSSLIATQTALATVQVERDTDFTVGTTWSDVEFETTAYENQPDIIQHDDVNTERILIKEDGTYSINYGAVVQANTTTTTTYSRIFKNGTTQVPASDSEIRTYQNERHELAGQVTRDLLAGDYITFQLQRSSDGTVTVVTCDMNVIKLNGVKGEKGDQGDQGPPGILTVSGTSYFDAYDSAGTLTLTGSWQDVPFNVVRKNSGDFTFTSNTELTIPSSMTYCVIARVTADITSGTNRSESLVRLVKDTGSGYVEIPGSRGALYHRTLGEGSNTATVNILDDFSAGDKIKVQIIQDSGSDTISLLANGSALSVYIPAGATGPQGPAGEDGADGVDAGGTMAVIQVRRTTQYTNIPLSWVDLTFDTTDIEYDDTVLEHDDTNRDRILIKRTGYYWIGCHFTVDDEARCRIRVNDTTVIPGSDRQSGDVADTNQIVSMMANPVIAQLTAGDFITVQIQATTSDEYTFEGATLIVFELLGAKGDKGDPGTPGSGSTINIYDEGSPVANTPHSLLNFTGAGVSVSDVDGDQVNIDIPGSSGLVVQEEGSTVTGGPHGTLNFIGSNITASNAGSGVANITVAPIFGSQFSSAAAEGETNTNSTSPVTKLTLSVTGIPAGTYRIGWYYEWRRNTTSNDYSAQIVIDSTTTIMEHAQESQDVNSWYTQSGFYIGSLTSGNHSIVLSYFGESTGNTSYTRRARLEIWRVS